MSEESGTEKEPAKTYSQSELDALIDEKTSGLKSKVDELLGEKKSASQKAKDADTLREKAEEAAAKQANDFESLFKSSELKRTESEAKYADLNARIISEKRGAESLKLAATMASGNNVDLLSEFIGRRIDVDASGKVVVLDAAGNPTVSTLDDLKKELKQSGRFDSLIDATKATGGGAASNDTGGAGSEAGKSYDKMNRADKIAYFKSKRG